MISTVTTSTVSILTTLQITGSLAVIAILILLVLMVGNEIATAVAKGRPRQFSRLLNISILPLLFAFILIAFFNIAVVFN